MIATVVNDVQQFINAVEAAAGQLWSTGWGAVLLCAVALTGAVTFIRLALRSPLLSERAAVGKLVAVGLAAAAGWAGGELIGSNYRGFAAAAAVGTVGLGLATSTTDAAKAFGSAAIGLIAAFAAIHTGLGSLVAVLAAAVAAWLSAAATAANERTASGAAVTAVFAAALGIGLTEDVIVDRLMATFVGGLAGVAISALPLAGTPKRTAERLITAHYLRVADVWDTIGAVIADRTKDPLDALDLSRAVVADIDHDWDTISAAIAHMRYSPAARGASSIARAATIADHGADQANNAARALFDLIVDGYRNKLSTDGPFAQAAAVAADLYRHLAGGEVSTGDGETLAAQLDTLASQAAASLREADVDTGVLLLGGQMVAAAAAAGDSISPSAAVDTDTPDADDVIPALLPNPRRGTSEPASGR